MDARLKMAATAEEEIPMPMADFTTLETIRLRLRHFTDAELATFIAYRNDPEVAKYQSWTERGKSEAHAFIQEQKEVQPGDPSGLQINR